VNWHRPGMYKKFISLRQSIRLTAGKASDPGSRETGAAAVGVPQMGHAETGSDGGLP